MHAVSTGTIVTVFFFTWGVVMFEYIKKKQVFHVKLQSCNRTLHVEVVEGFIFAVEFKRARTQTGTLQVQEQTYIPYT